jgi:hypothetical protein
MNSTANFTFPVGNFGYLGEIGITPTSSTATTFTAQYFRQTAYVYGDGNVEDPLHHVSALEHWTLDRESIPNAASGQVTLH